VTYVVFCLTFSLTIYKSGLHDVTNMFLTKIFLFLSILQEISTLINVVNWVTGWEYTKIW